MIFLTVGTQFPFDRLVRAVDEAVEMKLITDRVFAQIGENAMHPRNFEAVEKLRRDDFDSYFTQADYIISHAGMGSITMALEQQKPLLVMPRLKKYGEVVNDHQVAIAEKFEAQGFLLAAYGVESVVRKLNVLRTFVPQKRQTRVEEVRDRVSRFLMRLKEGS